MKLRPLLRSSILPLWIAVPPGFAGHSTPAMAAAPQTTTQLSPDQETFRREENRRGQLTTCYWDLPIHIVNLNAAE